MNDLRITMLGTTAAGKTCFMIGMYAAMRQGVRGFTFTAEDLDDDLDLSDAWDRLIEEHGEKRWPDGTASTKSYVFEFGYALRQLISFNWLDYRGGALSDRKGQDDVGQLLSYMQQSSSIFLCVSGEHLKESTRGREAQVSRGTRIDRMIQVLHKLPAGSRPSVAIVITKFDKVGRRSKEAIISDVKELFNPLFAPDSGWYVTICPVTLGKELDSDPDEGIIDPKNIHLPVTFAVYSAFQQEIHRLQTQRQEAYDQWQANQGWLNKLFDKKGLERRRYEVSKYDAQVADMERNMNLLVQELKINTDIYYNGRKEN